MSDLGLLRVLVEGDPATQGSMRAFVRGRRAVVTHDAGPALRAWRTRLAYAAKAHWRGPRPVSCALHVELHFRLARPKSHLRVGGELRASAPAHPTAKLDVDKLARAALDALTESGCWQDDGQVVGLSATKSYARPPETQAGVLVLVREV